MEWVNHYGMERNGKKKKKNNEIELTNFVWMF